MFRRRTVYTLLCLLATVLVGTVLVLSSITYYLSIDPAAYITEAELDAPLDGSRWNASEHGKVERIPRILHQSWKSETLPTRWVNVSQSCRDMNPDYEYKLWTDASGREFIAENYPWFLDTYDGYTYTIQRADAIRYFILYHFGGVYLDLDIGCTQPLDPLLVYPVILPKTIPVGVSNDLMFAEKGHPFMAQTMHNLVTFDHSWVLNYPTVMFSTGPMFLSAQYGLYTSSHPPTPEQPGGEVRILPKSLYGKNAKPEEAPHTFFTHYYGSSWHADDAAFIGFLGKWGKILMWVGLAILVIGLLRMARVPNVKKRKYSLRRIGGYDVLMPRWRTHNGRWYLDLGWFQLPASGAPTPQPASPISLSSSDDEDDVHLLPINLESQATSPMSSVSDVTLFQDSPRPSYAQPIVDAMRRAGHRVLSFFRHDSEYSALPTSLSRRERRRSQGVLFFMPAVAPSPAVADELAPPPRNHHRSRTASSSAATLAEYPPDKPRYEDDLASEDSTIVGADSPDLASSENSSSVRR
ncbi:hypothetical protein K474DRAFT_1132978 [Panus rudis PR-1116 ss-1]|nr:hypothetical protein K474DRAFT_1132978 [Panus rudis PR-1116 ss-1]